MSSQESPTEQAAVVQLAQRIMIQRGERWRQRRLNIYAEALRRRTGEIRERE